MSRHDFPAEEFATRRSRLWDALMTAELDWMIAIHPASLHWLTGSSAKSYQSFQCLVADADSRRIVVLTRESERNEWQDDALVDALETWGGPEPEDPIDAFTRLTEELGLKRGRGGMEVPAYYLHPHHYVRMKALLGKALVDAPVDVLGDLRQIKSKRELACIRRAARIADISVSVFAEHLAEGRSELEIAAEVYRSLLENDAGLPPTPLNLVSGPRAGFSHGAPTVRRLSPGDFGNIEYSVPYRGHSVSIGRQFSIGPPAPRARELYDVVREASDAGMSVIRAGVPAMAAHEAAKAVIAKAGLDRHRVHISGYAIGSGFPPTAGERLQLFEGSPYTLRAGMVLSVCPPVFIAEEQIGARLVDNVLVTTNGAERLTKSSRDLVVVD